MNELIITCAIAILLTVAVGLYRLLRGPGTIDRLGAMQLVGSGGTATLMLLAFGAQTPALLDLALVIALLAAFVSAAATLKVVSGNPRAPAAEP